MARVCPAGATGLAVGAEPRAADEPPMERDATFRGAWLATRVAAWPWHRAAAQFPPFPPPALASSGQCPDRFGVPSPFPPSAPICADPRRGAAGHRPTARGATSESSNPAFFSPLTLFLLPLGRSSLSPRALFSSGHFFCLDRPMHASRVPQAPLRPAACPLPAFRAPAGSRIAPAPPTPSQFPSRLFSALLVPSPVPSQRRSSPPPSPSPSPSPQPPRRSPSGSAARAPCARTRTLSAGAARRRSRSPCVASFGRHGVARLLRIADGGEKWGKTNERTRAGDEGRGERAGRRERGRWVIFDRESGGGRGGRGNNRALDRALEKASERVCLATERPVSTLPPSSRFSPRTFGPGPPPSLRRSPVGRCS